jgi:hypothetical protein
LLSQPRTRPDQRLDERHLCDVGRRARGDDDHSGELVRPAIRLEADDGSAGLRGRRKPGPDIDARQKSRRGQGVGIAGWPYPQHLAERVFSVVVHGDYGGEEAVQNALSTWLRDSGLVEAGHLSQVSRLVGYMEPYATSHEELDRDTAFQEETRIAARALVQAVKLQRRGELKRPDAGLQPARQK